MKGHKGHHHGHHGHHKAGGGRIGMVTEGNPDVLKEAKGEESYAKGDERKKGGHVKHKHRAKGGHVGHHEGHEHHGHHPHRHPGHKTRGRKKGGAVGADHSPLSSAHRGHMDDGKGSSSPKDTYGGTPP